MIKNTTSFLYFLERHVLLVQIIVLVSLSNLNVVKNVGKVICFLQQITTELSNTIVSII